MNDKFLIAELKEWCEKKSKEAGTEAGYYHKMVEVFDEMLEKLDP